VEQRHLIRALESKDYEQVRDALISIQVAEDMEPSSELTAILLDLCRDDDADIRGRAVSAAGFYLGIPEVLPIIEEILLRPDEDDIVLGTAISALGMLAGTPELRHNVLAVLSRTALNESMPDDVRKDAYLEALFASGRLPASDYAKMGSSVDQVTIDKEALASIASG
jgi:hypothetical protein